MARKFRKRALAIRKLAESPLEGGMKFPGNPLKRGVNKQGKWSPGHVKNPREATAGRDTCQKFNRKDFKMQTS